MNIQQKIYKTKICNISKYNINHKTGSKRRDTLAELLFLDCACLPLPGVVGLDGYELCGLEC